VAIRASGGNLVISGSPRIMGNYIAIYTGKGSSSTLTTNGGSIISETYTPLVVEANGNVTINNTTICAMTFDNAIEHRSSSTGTITITGTSKIGNMAFSDGACCILERSKADLNIQGSAMVMSVGGNTIKRLGTGKINLTGASSLYSLTTSDDIEVNSGYSCIALYAAGCTVTFNSTGNFFAGGPYVATAMENAATFNVTKGHFVSRVNRYMFRQSSTNNATHVGGTTTSRKTYKYMDGIGTISNRDVAGCYSYNKGV